MLHRRTTANNQTTLLTNTGDTHLQSTEQTETVETQALSYPVLATAKLGMQETVTLGNKDYREVSTYCSLTN